MKDSVLDVLNLRVSFQGTPVVDGVDVSIRPGEILGLVGESGSGKSVTCRAVMRLDEESGATVSGTVKFGGHENLLDLSLPAIRKLRGNRMAMVMQDPMTSLNPVYRVGDQVAEVFRLHRGLSKREARERAVDMLRSVELSDPEKQARMYPHELSGGMRQRVVIAMALACEPDLLIADEPTTALDVTTQAVILDLLRRLREDQGTAILFITHDLGVVSGLCDRVAVLYEGKLVESGPVRKVLDNPEHDYTRELRDAVPLPIRGKASPEPNPAEPLLRTEALKKSFDGVEVVRGVSLEVAPGETLGIVGESGSGKSTLLRMLNGLHRPDSGSVRFRNSELTDASPSELRKIRRGIQMIFQDPYASLNPRMKVSELIAEPLRVHGVEPGMRRKRVEELRDAVQLPADALDRYPHEFSGGQRQRIGIARALILKPELVLADEPVASLDVRVQAQILDLLRELRREFKCAMVFVAHDLPVVQHISDRVAVMKAGELVETLPAMELFDRPQHPYTQTLVDAVPQI